MKDEGGRGLSRRIKPGQGRWEAREFRKLGLLRPAEASRALRCPKMLYGDDVRTEAVDHPPCGRVDGCDFWGAAESLEGNSGYGEHFFLAGQDRFEAVAGAVEAAFNGADGEV